MQKLLVDWCTDEKPVPVGVDPDEPNVRVEVVREVGSGGGWPEVAVYASREPFEPEYMESMRLVGWLRDVYGADEDEADELASMAETV